MLCFCVSSLLTKKAPFWPSQITEDLATVEKEVIFFRVLQIFAPFTLLWNPKALKWQDACMDADPSEGMAQDRGRVCCHCCSQDCLMDAARLSDQTKFAVLVLLCMFTTLPISDFTELDLNKHTSWMNCDYCCFPLPSPLVIKTHYVESSAVLLCFPSVHTVLGVLDNTAYGSAISTILVLLQWDFMRPLVEKLQWFWLKIFHIPFCQISKFSRSCHWL